MKKGVGATKLLVIPMFPQYSESTIASGIDALAKELSKRVKIPTFEVITNFHRTHAFIDNSVNQVDEKLDELTKQGKKIDSLIITFHGMQKRRIVNKGDDYYRHCYETFCLITKNLKNIKPEQCLMSFQSRFGSEEWITPYTEDVVKKLISEGKREIAIYSPSFVADCLETTDELGHELVNEAKELGGIEGVMSFLPGVSKIKSQMDKAGVDEKIITQNEAIILSMTKKERENPKIIDGSRRKRIANGSGTDVATINKLLKQFKMMSDMMKKMSKGNTKGLMDKGLPPELFNQLK